MKVGLGASDDDRGAGATPALRLRGHVHAYTLERSALKSVLALAPVVISLPAPDGSFQRFRLEESAIMVPGLGRKHPGIKTYSGRG
jgi:trimeric autotransporter adhesin